jgi:hypothetical protein
MGMGILVLNSLLVKSSIIHTKSPAAIRLPHQQHRNKKWTLAWFYNTRKQEVLSDFLNLSFLKVGISIGADRHRSRVSQIDLVVLWSRRGKGSRVSKDRGKGLKKRLDGGRMRRRVGRIGT